MVVDATKAEDQKRKLTYELEKCGIRLNRPAPNMTITINKVGGVRVTSTKKLKYIDE